MRLIDADKVRDEVAIMWGDNSHITESLYEIIDNAPTVERPQGEWRNLKETMFNCSSCGVFWNTKWYGDCPDFCPHCGADMRGVKND